MMLPFAVSLRTGIPIYEQVVYAVTKAVVSGQLRAGDEFPSVRALSQELRINPNTAHRIVATLIEEGLLEVRPGIGTIIASHRRTAEPARLLEIEDQSERLVVESKRIGLGLHDVLAGIRRHWARAVRRAS
jgi:GntR family transcriptional regulator